MTLRTDNGAATGTICLALWILGACSPPPADHSPDAADMATAADTATGAADMAAEVDLGPPSGTECIEQETEADCHAIGCRFFIKLWRVTIVNEECVQEIEPSVPFCLPDGNADGASIGYYEDGAEEPIVVQSQSWYVPGIPGWKHCGEGIDEDAPPECDCINSF